MRIVIATDMEGAAGIDHVHQVLRDYPEAFEVGRHHLIADINACIRGLRQGGATEIKVVEQHGWGIYRAFDLRTRRRPEVLRGPASAGGGSGGRAARLSRDGGHAGRLSVTRSGRSPRCHSTGSRRRDGRNCRAGRRGAGDLLTGDDATLREADYSAVDVEDSVKRATVG
jgi:hypothetical protein